MVMSSLVQDAIHIGESAEMGAELASAMERLPNALLYWNLRRASWRGGRRRVWCGVYGGAKGLFHGLFDLLFAWLLGCFQDCLTFCSNCDFDRVM